MLIGKRIVRKDQVTSTNDLVKARGKEGEPEGLVVVARSQTAGRGRLGKSWSSPEGGLYFSALVRPNMGMKELLRMTVFACVPLAEALEEVSGAHVQVKWPNDLEVEGRKVGGILVEGVSKLNRLDFAIIGVGINVKGDPGVEGSISLEEAAGKDLELEPLFQAILQHLDSFYAKMTAGQFDEDDYVRRSSVLGHHVEAKVGNQVLEGKALYINPDGALVVCSEGLLIRLGHVSETSLRVVKGPESGRT